MTPSPLSALIETSRCKLGFTAVTFIREQVIRTRRKGFVAYKLL
jgi:hypothetical protein